MKFLVYIFILISGFSFSQEKTIDTKDSIPEIYTVVEEIPIFPGGSSAMMKFISSGIKYPEALRNKNIGGKVILRFIIASTGNVDSVMLEKSSGFDEIDMEAIRVVNTMPQWIPGKQNGKPVKVYFNVPIKFSLGVPFFIYDVEYKSEKYNLVKSFIIENKYQQIIDELSINPQENVNDIYNVAVANYWLKNNKKSKKNFEKVIEIGNEKDWVVNSSNVFLNKFF